MLSRPLDPVPSPPQRYATPRAQTGRGPGRRCPGVDRQGCTVSKGPQSITCPPFSPPQRAPAQRLRAPLGRCRAALLQPSLTHALNPFELASQRAPQPRNRPPLTALTPPLDLDRFLTDYAGTERQFPGATQIDGCYLCHNTPPSLQSSCRPRAAATVFDAPTAARALRCRALKEPCPCLAVLFSHGHPIATRARVAFDTTSTVSAFGRRPSRPDSDQSGWRCHASPAYRHAKDTACTTFVYQERARTSRIELIVLCPTNVDANGIAWHRRSTSPPKTASC